MVKNRIIHYLDPADLCGEPIESFNLCDPEYLDLHDDGGRWEPMTWRETVEFWVLMATATGVGVVLAMWLMRAAGLR